MYNFALAQTQAFTVLLQEQGKLVYKTVNKVIGIAELAKPVLVTH